MDVQQTIAGLNRILSMEYAAVIQKLQHSSLMQGVEREYLADFLREEAENGLKGHVRLIRDKIVALGGIPTVEPAPIKQTLDPLEMLQQNLDLERTIKQAQEELLQECMDDTPLRVMLEGLILDEQQEIEEYEKLLKQVKLAIVTKEVRLQQVK